MRRKSAEEEIGDHGAQSGEQERAEDHQEAAGGPAERPYLVVADAHAGSLPVPRIHDAPSASPPDHSPAPYETRMPLLGPLERRPATAASTRNGAGAGRSYGSARKASVARRGA